MKLKTKEFTFLSVIGTIISIIPTTGHTDHVGDTLDTGSTLSEISFVYVGLGLIFFILIMISAIWLIKKEKVENNDPVTYMDKVNIFSRNARLYILHIQGMSLTYGVRTIIYNFYLLYLFRGGVTIFGQSYGSVFFLGLLMAMGAIIAGIMSPFNGILVDKLGKKWSFIIGDFLGATMILLIIFFQTPAFVIFAQIFRAAAMSIHSIAEGPFIYEQSTAKERVHLFSVSSGMSTFASMSGNLIGGVVPFFLAVVLFDNPIVSGIASIQVLQAGLFVSVLLWWGSLIPAFYLKEDPELKIKANAMSVSSRVTFKNVKHWKTVWVFTLSSVFIGLGAGMFANFFEIFFLLLFSASPAEISIIFAAGSLMVAFGNISAPIFAERFGKVNMIVITRLVSIVFMVLLPLSPNLFGASFALLGAGVFYLFRGFFMNSTGPTESALAMEVIDDEERTTLEAFRIAGASIFSAIGFLVGGFYMENENFVTPFIYASVFFLIATVIFWLYFKNDKSIEMDFDKPTGVIGD